MTLQIQFKGINPRHGVRAWIEDGLRDLQKLTVITAATACVERRPDHSPPILVHVHLAVAGPDIHATAIDHTVQAGWLKILKNLRGQIVRRNANLRRRNTGEQLIHGPENRWTGPVSR